MANHPLDDFFAECYHRYSGPPTDKFINAIILCTRGHHAKTLRAAAVTWHPNSDWSGGRDFKQAMLANNPPLATNQITRPVLHVQKRLEAHLQWWEHSNMKRRAAHG
jgi:hypothetical protein